MTNETNIERMMKNKPLKAPKITYHACQTCGDSWTACRGRCPFDFWCRSCGSYMLVCLLGVRKNAAKSVIEQAIRKIRR